MTNAARTLPAGLTYEWTGISLEQIEFGSQAIVIFGLGLLCVFLVLAANYENYSDPVIILVSVPLAIAYYMKVATIKLPPGARQFRFRLGFGSGLNSRATSATIMFQAGLPPEPGAQGSPWSLAQAQTTIKVG